MARKVLVIGVDGATFDIILPLVKKGELPNFKKLMEEGAWGELESTIPPFSGPAWTSFQTGKSPANHGILDFVKKKKNSYESYYINSKNVKGPRLWDVLGGQGFKVGIINVMVTYPPSPVDGFILTGGLTPPGSHFSYPPELENEIRKKFGKYPLLPVGGIQLSRGDEEKYIRTFFNNEDKRIEIAKYLMRTRDWDFFMVMLEGADPLQHELWKYIDEKHPKHDKTTNYVKEAIPNFYKKVDRFINDCLQELGDEITLCVMSDHGFGPLCRYIIVNNFLKDIGMLHLKSSLGTKAKNIVFSFIRLDKLYKLLKRAGFSKLISTFRGGNKDKLLSQITLSFRDIDWSRTKAFSIGAGGQIYINVKGREPEGIVDPGKEYYEVRDVIIKKLKSLTDPKTGEKAIERVFTKEEVYNGKYFETAPDICFLYSRGYGTLHKEQFISPSIFIDSPTCGTHRMNGICLFYGSGICKGKIEGARIYDLAPTILHIFGLPIPVDMDG